MAGKYGWQVWMYNIDTKELKRKSRDTRDMLFAVICVVAILTGVEYWIGWMNVLYYGVISCWIVTAIYMIVCKIRGITI